MTISWKSCVCTALTALLIALTARTAIADSNASVLPDSGSTRVFAATEQFESPGGAMPPASAQSFKGVVMPHTQSGTLTLNRISSDSVRLTASDGLDPFDQTLHIDSRGAVEQPKPSYAFADFLNSVSTVMATAPQGLPKDANWNVTVSTPPWIGGFGGGSMPKQLTSIPMTMKVAAVSGNTTLVHGDGKNVLEMATGMGQQRSVVAMAMDCAFVADHVQKCTRKTSLEMVVGTMMHITLGDTVEIAAK